MALTDKGNPWPNGPKLSKKVKVDDLERQAQAYDYAIAQIDAEAKSIEDGTHPELVARVKALNNARDARVGHAASRLAPPWGGRGRAAPPSLRTLRLPPRSRARERPPAAPSQIARATRDFEAEMVTLDRLRDHEIEVSEREMRRRLETAEEKLLDQMAAAKARAEGLEDAARVNTRSLRSKESKDDDRNARRSAVRNRGPQTPATLLLDQGLTEAEITDDFVAIATDYNATQAAYADAAANGGAKRKRDDAD